MSDRDSLPLNDVDAACRDIEKQIDKMIFQKIDFIDIQEAAMRARQQAGLESAGSMQKRMLDIDRARHTILRRSEWEIDDRKIDRLRALVAATVRRAALAETDTVPGQTVER